ncbi:MAG: caspase family protein [Desulfobacula sp.]|jgi:hypothetical protein|nr:caspase family protein [Deltaproteobacteria bacterium]MBT6340328.1 caspase family protein [Desulfobacula sp.]
MKISLITNLIAGIVFFLTLAGPAATQQNSDGVAVIIGNKNYQNQIPQVDFAHRDAAAMKRFVIDELGYKQGNIIYLLDASEGQMRGVFGSKDNYKGKLNQYIRPGKSDVFIFYSGHGVPGLKDRRSYLLPCDASPDTVELNGYPLQQLYDNLGKMEAKSTLVCLDACFSGDSPNGILTQSASSISVIPYEPKNIDHLNIITAASGGQLASWDSKSRHGLFTEILLQGLYGKADEKEFGGNGDNEITLLEMKKLLDDEMTYLARRHYNREQVATIKGNNNFILASHGNEPIVRPKITLDSKPLKQIKTHTFQNEPLEEKTDHMIFRIKPVKYKGSEIPGAVGIIGAPLGNMPDAIVENWPPQKGDITVTTIITKNKIEREDNPELAGAQMATALFGKAISSFTKDIPKYIYHYEVDVLITAKNTQSREVKTANGSAYLKSQNDNESGQILIEALTEGANNLCLILMGGVSQPHEKASVKRNNALMAFKKSKSSQDFNQNDTR